MIRVLYGQLSSTTTSSFNYKWQLSDYNVEIAKVHERSGPTANLAPSRAGREVWSPFPLVEEGGGPLSAEQGHAPAAPFTRSPSSPSLSTLSGHQYEHFTFPSTSALTSSSLKKRRMNVNSDSNGDINSASRIRGRQRSLSDTSDTTVVPATFAKDTKALKGASNEPLATRHRTPLSFPPRNNDDKIRTTNASSSNILTPPTSDSSTSQESIKQRSSSSHKSTYATFNHHAPSSSSAAQTLSPRALQTLLVSLQLLSLVPAIVGGIYCIYRAILPQTRPMPLKGGLVKTLEWNRRVEWLLCAMWAGLSGNYCHSMARGLTRRWLVYYPLPAAVIRLVGSRISWFPP